ncbi:MAG: ABC transporter substrate-binding protein [Actinomycetota bacterium]|nr:ABC transporter substrate-binding protein [Actinomycetota bacterium]
MRLTRPRTTLIAILGLLAVALLGAGCGSSNNNSTSTSGGKAAQQTATPGINVAKDPKIAAAVPKSISSTGTLSVAADATYPPDEFIAPDGKTVIGMDADLAKAIAQVMGLKAEVQNITFDAIIPGLAAKKYDLGMSSFTDTKEREATVDFVTYLTAGTSFYVKTGGPRVESFDALCGKSAAVERGTIQADAIAQQDKKCKAAGKPGVELQVLPDQNAANLAISSGRAEVGAADTPVAAYIAEKSNGQFEVASPPLPPEPYGIAIPKGNGMAKPVLDAVKAVIADGTYDKILKYWGLQDGALNKPPEINGAVS